MKNIIPKFGHSCDPRKSVLSEIEIIADMGFDFAEITMEAPHGDPAHLWKQRNKIKTALMEYNVFATAHAPLALDLGNFFEPVRRLWLEHSRKIIKMAEKIGIEKINFHANYSSLIIKNAALKKLILENHVRSFKVLTATASKYNVQILVENTHESLRDFVHIAKGKNLFVTLDVGHAFMHGGDALIKRYIKTFPNISHLHVHDNNGKRDEHLAIGQGKIDFPLLVMELKRSGFDGTTTLEVFTKNRALAKVSLNKLKKMWFP